MKKILFAFFLALLQVCAFAQTPFTAPWGFNYSAPTGAPSALGTRVRLDITTGRIYTWSPDALNWQLQGYTIDQISGTSAPAYAPVRGQSWFAVNGDTLPRLYQYTGSGTVWKCLNCSDGKTYTAGTGITLSGPNLTVINNAGDLSNTNELNTGFDVSGGNLRIIDAGATRTVAVTSIAPDQSVTNEIQTIDTFLVSGSNLLLSLTQDNQPAKTITLPASGITSLTGDVTATGPGSAVASIANRAVTGAKINQMSATTGQVLTWDGSTWNPATPSGGGWGFSGNSVGAGSYLGTTNNRPLRFRTNNVQRMILDSLGRLGINGSSALGLLHITGTGLTSGTTPLQITNSSGAQLLQIRDDGAMRLTSSSTGFTIYPFSTDPATPAIGQRYLTINSAVTSQGGTNGLFCLSGVDITATGTTTVVMNVSKGFAPTSGSVDYVAYQSRPTINQTGGANGPARMFYANPVVTASTNIRSFEYTNNVGTGWGIYGVGTANNALSGSTIIGATATPSARLHVQGAGATSSTWTAQFHNSTGTNNAFMVRDDGNVGVGTNAPTARIDVRGSTADNAASAILIQNSTPADLLSVRNDGRVALFATNTATGATGAQTINRPSGTVNFAAGATSIVVTNSLVTASSLVFATVRTNDATATIKNVVPGAGSFTITLTAAATAETSVGFFVIN